MPSKKPEISVYENEIPHFVEPELDRLYGGRFSSMLHFRLYEDLKKVNTYVCHIEGKIVTVLLFRIVKQRVHVLNQVIRLSSEEIRYFTDYIFSRYQQISTIMFRALEIDRRDLPWPYQSIFYDSEMWLTVPSSSEEYLNDLGRNTRQGIRQSIRKLKKNFPSFDYRFMDKEEVSEHDIRTIISFNRTRQLSKGKIAGNEEQEIQRIIKITKKCGIVCTVKIDGRVCAGTISYRFGENFAFRVTGYDLAYDSYRLGFIANFLTFCECIDRGAKNIYMGWGAHHYKFMLGGAERNLEHLVIFRSWGCFFLSLNMVLRLAIKGSLAKAKRAIKVAAERRNGLASSMARTFIAMANRLRYLSHIHF